MKPKAKTLKITLEIHIEGAKGVHLQAQVYRLIGKMVRMFDRQGLTVPPDTQAVELEIKGEV